MPHQRPLRSRALPCICCPTCNGPESYPTFQHGPVQEELGLQDMVDFSAGYNPRTLQLAQDIRRDPRYARADAATLVNVVMEKLRTEGYSYTLDPGVFGTHTADEFWFDRKQGFCEHIASNFVLLMRALDIPARVVTGYQGGEPNGVDGLWTVRQSDAHAWAEVWMAGRGWVRVDPTSAVAPGRTSSFQRLLPVPGLIAQALNTLSPDFEINLRALWEATNNRWNQWVLNRVAPTGAAAQHWLRLPQLGRPELPADWFDCAGEFGWCRMDPVGTLAPRPVAAPLAWHHAQIETSWHNRGGPCGAPPTG